MRRSDAVVRRKLAATIDAAAAAAKTSRAQPPRPTKTRATGAKRVLARKWQQKCKDVKKKKQKNEEEKEVEVEVKQ